MSATSNASNLANNLNKFDHVVVLMMENRSFDNLLFDWRRYAAWVCDQGICAIAFIGKTVRAFIILD